MKLHDDIFDCIGHTPIIPLPRLSEAAGAEIFAKVELTNPGGSIKDRAALAMVRDAERLGRLSPGSTIVEATAGNTGIALAWIAAARGYRFVAVVSEADLGPKTETMEAMGAEVVTVPVATSWSSPLGALGVARRIERERRGVFLNQFSNPSNPLAHEGTTAVEIRQAFGDRLDAVVAGIGSGGTITGIARALKPVIPNLRVIGATGIGSYLGSAGHGRRIPGITPDFAPAVFRRDLVDRIETLCPADAGRAARCLAEVEGVPAGHSSGACLLAAENEARHRPGSRILMIVADSIRNYPSLARKPVSLELSVKVEDKKRGASATPYEAAAAPSKKSARRARPVISTPIVSGQPDAKTRQLGK